MCAASWSTMAMSAASAAATSAALNGERGRRTESLGLPVAAGTRRLRSGNVKRAASPDNTRKGCSGLGTTGAQAVGKRCSGSYESSVLALASPSAKKHAQAVVVFCLRDPKRLGYTGLSALEVGRLI